MNKDGWEINEINKISSDKLTGSLYFPADSYWFDGHFPDNPVVPGVALLAFAKKIIDMYFDRNGSELNTLNKVQFKKILTPGDIISFEFLDRGDRFSFTFKTSGNELVSRGSVKSELS